MPYTKVRLTPWYNPVKGSPRSITETEAEQFIEISKSIPNCCEWVDGGKCKVYLDWDRLIPVSETFGKPAFILKNERKSIRDLIDAELKKIPLFRDQPYTVLHRDARLYKNDTSQVKYSYHIIFNQLITDDHKMIKTYLQSLDYKNNKPFDLDVYDKNQTINCLGSTKPDKIEENVAPLKVLWGETDIRKMLITCVDNDLPTIDWTEWVTKPVEKPAVIKSQPLYKEGRNMEEEIKCLLLCITADCDYGEWFDTLVDIKSCLGGTMSSLHIACEWSKTAPHRYDEVALLNTWGSIHNLTKKTIGSLIRKAKLQQPERFKEEYLSKYASSMGERREWDDLMKIDNYQEQKEIFETRVAKIIDSVRFIYTDDEECRVYSRKGLREAFENITYTMMVKNKETKKQFIDTWFMDNTMRQYKHAEVIPPPLKTPPTTYNMWMGWKWQGKDDLVGGETKTINEHLRMLCDYQDEIYHHLRKTFAYKIQYPAKKTNVMLVIVGDEGVGKSIFYEVIKRVWGADKCVMVSSPDKELFGTFAYKWADKQMVLLNDFNPTELKKTNAERMKAFITEKDIMLERKGIDQYTTEQYVQFLAFSNTMAPVPINSGSRRYFIIKSSSCKAGDTDYFKKLGVWMGEDKNIKAFFDELMTMDLTDFTPHMFPETQVMKIAKEANMCSTELFINDRKSDIIRECITYEKQTDKGYWKETKKMEEGCRMVMYHDTLYDAYNDWCNSLVNIPYKMHKRKFQSEVFRLQSRLGLEYLRNEKHPVYTRWLITDTEKWKSIQFIEEEDEL